MSSALRNTPATPLPDDHSDAPEGMVVGRYVVFPAIAMGGMASVHLGRLSGPVGFSRTVAVKRLHPQFAGDPEFVSMFLDEARLAARVQHPNVVSVLDVVALEGELFLIMDFVRGESLSRLLQSCRESDTAAPIDCVVSILAGILHGLHAAHEARDERGEPLGMVHRDVSPQNVLVGADGVPRLVDFGVARARDRVQFTREGQIKGKLDYLAPEQLECEPATRQTDIYAASIVLWEALAGQRLFGCEEVGGKVTRTLLGRFPPPSSVNPAVSSALDSIVMKGMARRPEDRFATAREMAMALERAVPAAPASRIGDWVLEIAADRVFDRDRMITRIEALSDSAVRRRSSLLEEVARSRAAVAAEPTLERRRYPRNRRARPRSPGNRGLLCRGAYFSHRPGTARARYTKLPPHELLAEDDALAEARDRRWSSLRAVGGNHSGARHCPFDRARAGSSSSISVGARSIRARDIPDGCRAATSAGRRAAGNAPRRASRGRPGGSRGTGQESRSASRGRFPENAASHPDCGRGASIAHFRRLLQAHASIGRNRWQASDAASTLRG